MSQKKQSRSKKVVKKKPLRTPKKKKSSSVLLKDIWPMERDLVVRPERMRYVRRMIKTTGCVFCEAATTLERDEKQILLRTSLAMVILNKYPYNSGHLLVLPTRHVGDMADLTDQEYQQIMELVRHSVKCLQQVYACEGLNIGINLGSAAGAGIPDHFHCHIIPRWNGDTNFFPLIAETKLIVETAEQTYMRLKDIFLKMEKDLYAKK